MRLARVLLRRLRLWAGIAWRRWDELPDGTVIRIGPVTAWEIAAGIHPWRDRSCLSGYLCGHCGAVVDGTIPEYVRGCADCVAAGLPEHNLPPERTP